ncbi:hypothetical protein BCR35DRAFT_302110 [Leucosporidium creatinivorum]|uniref:Zn(2)-C6 fungal-type domain-containing protein n=1 Tax=Leucosporidium creatinivorum TaxID=106004 RepID=A0A1Y2FVZ1_9BASI|nr:hypothetical protein BCR35DRAFT_302110 [Leucosporidium creatinivorum]
MSDPTGKAARVARSRAACVGCRSTKQKCDGPNVIPCRRCQLYGIECEYPPSSGPAPSKPAARPAAPSAPISLPAFAPRQPTSAQDTLMNDRFREISDRLKAIESSLSRVHLSPNGASHSHSHHLHDDSPSSVPSLHHSTSSPDSSSAHTHPEETPITADNAVAQNALQTISDALGLMEAREKAQKEASAPASPEDWLSGMEGNGAAKSAEVSSVFDGIPKPDAIVRGIMTAEECEGTFKIFFRLLAPWVMFFDQERDSNAAEMRERSPILFHVILLSVAYYLMGKSERATTIYHNLMALVNELIAPILISTQGFNLKTDLVRALNLLMLFKPVQFATLHSAGITDPAQAEQVSKLNGSSSATLYSIMTRVAFSTSLHSAPNNFTKIYSPGTPPPPALLSELRLWLWLCIVDVHGGMTAGRALALDVAEALRVTRMFAALNAQPGDARLAATVELYGVARAAISTPWFKSGGTLPVPTYELRRYNREIDDWEAYWRPELVKAAKEGDNFAMSVVNTFANTIRIVLNASIFTRWRHQRKLSLSRGGDGRPDLTDDDWAFLQLVTNATEALMFCVSVESRIQGSVVERAVQWPAREKDQPRARLTVDQAVVDTHRTAIDPITCISYIYPLILVAKMANAGLVRCEFYCPREEYELGLTVNTPQRLLAGAKLAILLQLGADFLTALAPTPTHPAHKHARMLRMVFTAGTLGRQGGFPVESQEAAGRLLSVLAASRSATPNRQQQESTAPKPTAEPTFSLPPLPNLPPTAPPTAYAAPPLPDWSSVPPEAGLALASILGGIQPAYFGESESASQGILFEDLGGSLSAMDVEVDWDDLEKSMKAAEMQQQQQQGVEAQGLDSGVAGMSGPFSASEWQGYFAQK